MRNAETSMFTRTRIGLYVPPSEPFWVQVREAIYARSQLYPIDLIAFENERFEQATVEVQQRLIQEFFHLKLQALIVSENMEALMLPFLQHNIPVVSLSEVGFSQFQTIHPRSLYDAAYMIGSYVVEQLQGKGTVVLLGGRLREDLDSRMYGDESRILGFYDLFEQHPDIQLKHIPTQWNIERDLDAIRSMLQSWHGRIDALVGISDPIILTGRKIFRSMGLIDAHTIITGINGDPLALSEIIAGRMSATVAISTEMLGETGVDLAYQAALCETVPPFFSYRQQLVTSKNALEIAAEKLIAISDLPSRLVGSKRQEERHRLAQYETSLAINQQVGTILNWQDLSQTAVDLIRANYMIDHVRLWLWQSELHSLKLAYSTQSDYTSILLPLARAGILATVFEKERIAFLADRVAADSTLEEVIPSDTQVRIVVPIRYAGQVIGLLDLLNTRPFLYTLIDLEGLQIIADQFGIALRNAQLYEEAVAARRLAEQTDQLKTRLLANVSHELRTPLLIILGYTELVLHTPHAYNIELPEALVDDLQHIHQSGQHLVQLSNDLLDLSRAEIGTLDLNLEMLEPTIFLAEIFARVVEGLGKSRNLIWHLDMPQQLPYILADQLRLRQILLNLLSNAVKYAPDSHITLGAETQDSQLHLWVADTGPGITSDIQEAVFEPFFTGNAQPGTPKGVGLGLTIARRLTMLHKGILTLESTEGQGSTFHIYLPLADDI